MRTHATINERILRRTFRERLKGKRGLTVFDKELRGFGLKISSNGSKTFIVHAARKLGIAGTVLGTEDELTAAEARERATAIIEAARTKREHGPLFRDFADEFMRRQKRRWKPTRREGNALLLLRYLLKRLDFVLDHAKDKQAAAAIHLLLFTGARSSEITGLRWDGIRGTRAVLPDSKTGPKAVQLPPPARAVLNGLPRTGPFVFPNRNGAGPMTDLGLRWPALRALAGLDDVRVHDCRHTLASHAVMSGLDLYTVGRLLGHADTGSTERYAHLADEHVREAPRRISGIVHDATTGSGKEAGHDR